jgi:hypothetical protein
MDSKTRGGTVAQGTPDSTEEQVQKNGDEKWQKFAEPRGWAVKWDGFALAGMEERRNRNVPPSRP